jgi:hypothetical protein
MGSASEKTNRRSGSASPQLHARARTISKRLRAGFHGDEKVASLREAMVKNLFEDLTLGFNLPGVFQLLPLASAASPEIRAPGLYPSTAGFKNPNGFSAEECLLFLDRPHQEAVSRDGKRDKDHFPFPPAQTRASIDELFNSDPERSRRTTRFIHIV